ncbi:unnamed protein product, partial [Choristocarpus tenellus]
ILGGVAAFVNLMCFILVAAGANVLLLLILLFIRPFDAKFARRLNSVTEALFVEAVSAILPPSKLVITGEMPDAETQAIVVANHQVGMRY